ncbi:hypothetical protein N7G274_007668 [Stereocaulon virgatum]|uniref:Uncharacterized protein n=1 Tax=Stereocaulon virgatum TaxID=373712 RepID=A0ABR4A393_9LECA
MVVQQGSWSKERCYALPLERLLILRNLWSDNQTKQAFESEEQIRKRKNVIIEKQAASEYLMQMNSDLGYSGSRGSRGDNF